MESDALEPINKDDFTEWEKSLAREVVRLSRLVKRLRHPEKGCPWDRVQTQESLVPFVLEESLELARAIWAGDSREIQEELGDYLYQVLIQAQIASEKKDFDLVQVVSQLSNKLVRRHPHVFGEVKANTIEEVKRLWKEIKQEEKTTDRPKTDEMVDNPLVTEPEVIDESPQISKNKELTLSPSSSPTLKGLMGKRLEVGSREIEKGFTALRDWVLSTSPMEGALALGEFFSVFDFDWKDAPHVFQKVMEEWEELQQAHSAKDFQHEWGDVFFALVQWARHLGVNPIMAMAATNKKFLHRIEAAAAQGGYKIDEFLMLPQIEKEKCYQLVKKNQSPRFQK